MRLSADMATIRSTAAPIIADRNPGSADGWARRPARYSTDRPQPQFRTVATSARGIRRRVRRLALLTPQPRAGQRGDRARSSSRRSPHPAACLSLWRTAAPRAAGRVSPVDAGLPGNPACWCAGSRRATSLSADASRAPSPADGRPADIRLPPTTSPWHFGEGELCRPQNAQRFDAASSRTRVDIRWTVPRHGYDPALDSSLSAGRHHSLMSKEAKLFVRHSARAVAIGIHRGHLRRQPGISAIVRRVMTNSMRATIWR